HRIPLCTLLSSAFLYCRFYLLLFSLTSPPPPRSTLFPYTTLFRFSLKKVLTKRSEVPDHGFLQLQHRRRTVPCRDPQEEAGGFRSEEHTSELQSRFDLVCRLLLEKKNTKTRALTCSNRMRQTAYASS